jgi:SAM-dependent methyltransferase
MKPQLADVENLYRDWAVSGGYPTLRPSEYAAVLSSCPLLAQPGQRVLDIGCGVGIVAQQLKAMGHHVTGLDIVREALDVAVAEKRVDEAIHGDFTAVGIPGHSYDVVLFWGVLLLIFELDVVFRRAAQVLRPGGQVLVVDHHSANPYTKLHFSRPDWVDRVIEGRSNTARRALNPPMIREAGGACFDWDEARYWSLFTRHPHRLIDGVHSVARFSFACLHQVWRPPWSFNFVSMSGTVKGDARTQGGRA